MQQNTSDNLSSEEKRLNPKQIPLLHPLTPLRISYKLIKKVSSTAFRIGRRRTSKAGMAFYQHLFQKIGDDFKPY